MFNLYLKKYKQVWYLHISIIRTIPKAFRYWRTDDFFFLVLVHKGVSRRYNMTFSRILLSRIRRIERVLIFEFFFSFWKLFEFFTLLFKNMYTVLSNDMTWFGSNKFVMNWILKIWNFEWFSIKTILQQNLSQNN